MWWSMWQLCLGTPAPWLCIMLSRALSLIESTRLPAVQQVLFLSLMTHPQKRRGDHLEALVVRGPYDLLRVLHLDALHACQERCPSVKPSWMERSAHDAKEQSGRQPVDSGIRIQAWYLASPMILFITAGTLMGMMNVTVRAPSAQSVTSAGCFLTSEWKRCVATMSPYTMS